LHRLACEEDGSKDIFARLFADDTCAVGKSEAEIMKVITVMEKCAQEYDMLVNKLNPESWLYRRGGRVEKTS
jgi:hypothetical protein